MGSHSTHNTAPPIFLPIIRTHSICLLIKVVFMLSYFRFQWGVAVCRRGYKDFTFFSFFKENVVPENLNYNITHWKKPFFCKFFSALSASKFCKKCLHNLGVSLGAGNQRDILSNGSKFPDRTFRDMLCMDTQSRQPSLVKKLKWICIKCPRFYDRVQKF